MNSLILLLLAAMPQPVVQSNSVIGWPTAIELELESAVTFMHEGTGASICSMNLDTGHWTFAPGESPRSCKDAIVQYSPGKKEII